MNLHHVDFSDDYGEPDYGAVMDAIERGAWPLRSSARDERAWAEGWPIARRAVRA